MNIARSLTVITIATIVSVGCTEDPEVASWGQVSIRASDVRDEVAKLPTALRERLNTEAGRRQLIEAIVQRRALAISAKQAGLDQDPAVQGQLARAHDQVLAQALMAHWTAGLSVDEAHIRSWYAASATALTPQSSAHLQQILLRTNKRTKGHAERELLRAAARIRQGTPFAVVAREIGEGPEAAAGGDLGTLAVDQLHPTVQAAVLATDVGEMSDVIESPFGLHLIKVIGRTSGSVPPLDEVRPSAHAELLARLRRDVYARKLAEITGSSALKIDHLALDRIFPQETAN